MDIGTISNLWNRCASYDAYYILVPLTLSCLAPLNGLLTAHIYPRHMQTDDVQDVYAALFPKHQLLIETDWSSGHSAGKKGGLNVNSMNVKFGGVQEAIRPGEGSLMTAACLGSEPAVLLLESGELVDCKLKVGEVQQFQWPADPGRLRPFDNRDAEVSSFAGMPKGLKQVAWERGLYQSGMKAEKLKEVLGGCEDFMNETTAFQDEIARRGNIGLLSPKGHPELAGVGIEYCWGRSKQYFHRHNDGPENRYFLCTCADGPLNRKS